MSVSTIINMLLAYCTLGLSAFLPHLPYENKICLTSKNEKNGFFLHIVNSLWKLFFVSFTFTFLCFLSFVHTFFLLYTVYSLHSYFVYFSFSSFHFLLPSLIFSFPSSYPWWFVCLFVCLFVYCLFIYFVVWYFYFGSGRFMFMSIFYFHI